MPERTDAETLQAYLQSADEWDARAANARADTERDDARRIAASYRALARAVGWNGEETARDQRH
jgi:hypothetical protein